jgi:hypothetical protein
MRRITTGTLFLAAAALAGCGSGGGHFANRPRPPSPVNETVYINDQHVSVSPTSVGAGPVVFIVTNQASQSEGLTVTQAGQSASQPLAETAPISPQATAQVTVDFQTPGDYVVQTSSGATSEAAAAVPAKIAPALLHIGPQRPSSSGELLSP